MAALYLVLVHKLHAETLTNIGEPMAILKTPFRAQSDPRQPDHIFSLPSIWYFQPDIAWEPPESQRSSVAATFAGIDSAPKALAAI